MENRVNNLEKDMVDVKTRLAVAENNIKDIKEDIGTIKDDTRWLRRTITSSIVAVVIAVIIAVVKMGVI